MLFMLEIQRHKQARDDAAFLLVIGNVLVLDKFDYLNVSIGIKNKMWLLGSPTIFMVLLFLQHWW